MENEMIASKLSNFDLMAIISQLRNNKILLKGGLFSLFSFFNQGVGFLLLIIWLNTLFLFRQDSFGRKEPL